MSKVTPGDEYQTPQHVLSQIMDSLAIREFALDAAADEWNHLAPLYYSIECSGLTHPWKTWTWCNPPYSKEAGPLIAWVKKAAEESSLHNKKSVMLLPADTSTAWFDLVMRQAAEVLFLRPRVRFIDPSTGKKAGSPKFGSLVAVFDHERAGRPPSAGPQVGTLNVHELKDKG